MLDLALAVNALIWFATLILPVYGFVTGFKGMGGRMKRATIIITSLVVLLLALEVTIGATEATNDPETLSLLQGYRPWLFFGVASSMALGWALFVIGKAMRARF